MVRPDFSEFQFAYGITKELEESLGSSVVAPPVFPTQYKEKQIGSDVVMRIRDGNAKLAPLFIQYKRSNRMIRSYADEWDDFGQNYFRFSIHNENQHNTLMDMAEKGGLACYIAPGFHKRDEYVQNHRGGRIAVNSVCIDVEDIGRVNGDDHRIAYTVSPLKGMFYSEPKGFDPISNIYTLFDEMLGYRAEFYNYDTLRGEFRELRDILIERTDLEAEGYFEGDGPADWIRNQQQFFFEVADTQLLFATRDD